MFNTQERNGTTINVILCGGGLAPVSVNSYAGCNGTGWYRAPLDPNSALGQMSLKTSSEGEAPTSPRKCYRCEGWGYQSKSQYFRNIAYDRRAEARLAKEMANES